MIARSPGAGDLGGGLIRHYCSLTTHTDARIHIHTAIWATERNQSSSKAIGPLN